MMKKITLLVVFVISANFLFAQEDIDRYLVKSGYIEYDLTGSTKGTKKIWWDDYGDKEREEVKSISEVRMFGMVQKEEVHSINISVGEKFWHSNLLDGTGVTGVISDYDVDLDYTRDLTDEEKKQLENEILQAFGGERLNSEEFLGFTCEVIQVLGTKSWFYKGLVLKSTANMMGIEVNETAIKFDENIEISSSKFEPPKDINFEEGEY